VAWGNWQQTSKPAERRKGTAQTFASFSKEPPLLSTSSFWVWTSPSTTLTLWSLSRNWVSILKELRSLPPSSMCTLWTFLLNLSIRTRCALSSTVINSHQELVSGQACDPLDPHWCFLSFSRWRSFTGGTRYQSGSLSLTNVGSGFHCDACVVLPA